MHLIQKLDYIMSLAVLDQQHCGRVAERINTDLLEIWTATLGEEVVQSARNDTDVAIRELKNSSPKRRGAAVSLLANWHKSQAPVETAIRSALDVESDQSTAASMAKSYAQLLSHTRLFPLSFSLAHLSFNGKFSPQLRRNLLLSAMMCFPGWPDKIALFNSRDLQGSPTREEIELQARMICYYGNPFPSNPVPNVGQLLELVYWRVESFLRNSESSLHEADQNGVRSCSAHSLLCSRSFLISGDVRRAIEHLSAAISLDPMYGRLWYERALHYKLLGESEGHRSDMSQAGAYGNYY